MTAAPGPYHHGDVRRSAVVAVEAAVRTGGEAGVTIRSIAAAVGVSHAALYRHVRSVDDLFDEVGASFLDRMVGGADRDEPVTAFLERYVEAALAEPSLYRLAFTRAGDDGRAPATVAAVHRLRAHAAAVFAQGWPDDDRRAVMHRVIRTWSTVHGMLDLAAHGLVVTDSRTSMARYVVRSAMRSAEA